MRYARICPNTNGWKSPSGGQKWSRLSFPGLNGFGFDEWVLGTPTIRAGPFAGYKAGFIQGFRRYQPGTTEDVSCYWIDGAAPRRSHLAIVILNCQKLSESDALAIRSEYAAAGFIRQMTSDLIGLNPPVRRTFPPAPLDMFNVAFKEQDVTLVSSPQSFRNRGYQYDRLFN